MLRALYVQSGHSPAFMRQILIAGITSYERLVQKDGLPKDHHGYKPLHKHTKYKKMARSKKKAMNRTKTKT